MINIKNFLQSDLSKYKILVIGDSILDKYYYGETNRISPEAPVPIVHFLSEKNKLGGAGNVANNLQILGCNTSIITFIGLDNNGQILTNLFKNIKLIPISIDKQTTKIRIICNKQQMLRLDFENSIYFQNENLIINTLHKEILNNDLVIISDYNKGFCTKNICKNIINICNTNNKLVIIDPKGNNWDKYINASYITPNFKEFNEILNDKIDNTNNSIEKYGKLIKDKFNLQGLLITRGEDGLSILNKNCVHIKANKKDVIDVTGAGDTMIAFFSLAKVANLTDIESAYLANLAASITCMHTGTYAPIKEEILNLLN